MRKTFLLLPWILIAFLLSLQVFWLFIPGSHRPHTPENCPFCNPAIIAKQQYYEGDQVRALLNYKPVLQGHSLIIPKRHVERFEELTSAEVEEMHRTVVKVQEAFAKIHGSSDYLLLVQNGETAGQTVFHTHLHMVPRAEKNLLAKLGLWWLMFTRPFRAWWPVDWQAIEGQRLQMQESM